LRQADTVAPEQGKAGKKINSKTLQQIRRIVNAAMNKAVYEVAREHIIKNNKITEGILNQVEVAIRCYDPCLSCSTHTLGQMPLHIQIISAEGEVLEEIPR